MLTAAAAKSDPADLIGRLSHAGFKTKAHCTATLIEGGHIVTAAHCLPNVATDTVTIALGYDRGSASNVIRAAGNEFRRDATRDLAVLCGTGSGQGVPVADDPPNRAEPVQIAGYGIPRVHALQLRSCQVAASGAGGFAVACPSPPGTSGGPVFLNAGASAVLAGVISATSPDQTIAVRVTAADIDQACPAGQGGRVGRRRS
ncbi:MAG: serine protease [Rhodobacter sp.]|nr:serine protease [Rhodobacter sp.]